MDMPHLLAESRDFLARHGEVSLVDQLLEYCNSNQFKLCVVGGFSRGKSHFINLLLGSPILPESAVPTTGCRTEIRYGSEEKLEILYPDRVDIEPLSAARLEKFSMYNGPAAHESLKIYLPLPMLEGGLIIIDTPGIEDPIDGHEEVSQATLMEADGAIVMVSAVSPFSLTESAFIREYMLDRKLPLIAAGISYSDMVPETDRKKQLEFIIKRCHQVYPNMKILVPECHGVLEPDLVCGVQAIKKLIEHWQKMPNLETLKRRTILNRLREALEGIKASLEARREMFAGDVKAANARISDAIANLEDGSELAMDLRLKFINQAEAVKDEIRRDLNRFCDNMLRHAGNLSEEKVMDAAFALNETLTQKAKDHLKRAVTDLSSELEEHYGVPAKLDSLPEIEFTPLVLTRIDLEAGSQNQWIEEIYQKGLYIGDMYARRFPGGTIVWNAVKPHIRTLLSNALNQIIGDAAAKSAFRKEMKVLCAAMGREITDGVQRIYHDVFAQIKAGRLEWLARRRAELAENLDAMRAQKNLAEIDGELDECKRLAKGIDKELGEKE